MRYHFNPLIQFQYRPKTKKKWGEKERRENREGKGGRRIREGGRERERN